MNIKYEFVTGEIVEVEVSDGIGEVSVSIDKEIFNSNRRETRRHNSFENMQEQGFQLSDESFDIVAGIEASASIKAIYDALANLLPQQRDLIQKMYFKEMSVAQIARDEGVGESAIRDRLNRIYKKLKKFFYLTLRIGISRGLYIEAPFTASKEGGDKMQTIKITITAPTSVNIVVKECTPEKPGVEEKLAKLLKKLQEV